MIFTAQSNESNAFKAQIENILRKLSPSCRVIKISKNLHVYTAGQRDDNLYLIESGCIKLLWPTPAGHKGLVAIYSAGDLFGESCLSGETRRSEAAVAMMDSSILKIPRDVFMAVLGNDTLLMSMAQYLAARIADRQRIIASLLAANNEHKLAVSLLQLGRRLGKSDADGVRIDQEICRRELAAMTGATRLRIGTFIKRFERLGLVKGSKERSLVVDELKVNGYLTMIASGEGMSADRVQ